MSQVLPHQHARLDDLHRRLRRHLRQRHRPGYRSTEQSGGLRRRQRPELDLREAAARSYDGGVDAPERLVGRDEEQAAQPGHVAQDIGKG